MLAVEGMPAPEAPERLAWDICQSHWNSGPLLVNFPQESDAELVCFAPPGASLHGDRGLELATWRRGIWSSEAEFVSKRAPRVSGPRRLASVSAEIPDDFERWTQRETVAHIERLSAFAQRRPHRPEWRQAADRLCGELEDLYPGAVEECRIDFDVAAARRELLDHEPGECQPELIPPAKMSKRQIHRLFVHVTLLIGLYALYIVARPGTGVDGERAAFPHLSVADALLWVYGNSHVVVAFGFFGWVFFRRHRAFKFVRNAVLIAAVLTVVPYLLLTPHGIYPAGATRAIPASAVPTMPAMHLCVAVLIGCCCALLVRSRLAKALWLSYPALTLLAIVASDPRYLLVSVFGGCLVTIFAVLLAWLASLRRRSWRPPPVLIPTLPRIPAPKGS